MPLRYIKPEPIELKTHPEFNEKWLQEKITDDPSILGLGDLEVRDVEKIQPSGGRLDLLLREPEGSKRYEVEIQLGAVDPSHIIRTLEYWDIERKRYPQFDHCAVIVAEEITSRFLNVIGLFNSAIPLIAIQINAFKVADSIVLCFVKVLDEVVLGDDGEAEVSQPADRAYWEQKGSPESLALADACLNILHNVSPQLSLNYNKHYIGLKDGGKSNNFVIFWSKKKLLKLGVKLSEQDSWRERLEENDIVVLEAGKGLPGFIRMQLKDETIRKNEELLRELFEAAYKEQHG